MSANFPNLELLHLAPGQPHLDRRRGQGLLSHFPTLPLSRRALPFFGGTITVTVQNWERTGTRPQTMVLAEQL